MATRQHRPGMTPAEVLVFAATCTLLGLVLIPTLARAGGGSTRATCLQNLQALGAATQMYAEQDSRELLMPLHAMQVVDIGPLGGLFNGTVWSYRTANWFTWGGATATEEFYVAPSSGPLLGQGDTGRYYGAQTRPLTRFLYPDITEDPDAGMYVTNLPAFRCPRDVGFPSITLAGGEQLIDDSPEANADRPCYDTLGTSYRPNLAGYFGGAYHFTYGPAGHKRSDLATPERVIFGGDAVWAVHTGGGFEYFDPWDYAGWHGEILRDNILRCDGSARLTDFADPEQITPNARLPIHSTFGGPPDYRGASWHIDTYPTPGAWVFGSSADMGWIRRKAREGGWPFEGFRNGLQPVTPPWETP